MKTNLKKDLLCVLLILLCAVGFLWKYIFTGKTLVPGDLLSTELPWAANFPPGAGYHNTALFDALLGVYPFQTHNIRTLKEGVVPLWNPHQFAGTPFAADAHSGVFYPVSISIFLLMGVLRGLTWNALLHLWLAGFGMFLLVRAFGAGRTGALFSGIAYMLCGWFALRLTNLPLLEVAAWMPMMTLFYVLSLKRGMTRYAVLCGLVLGLEILTGMLQMAAYSVSIILLWMLFCAGADAAAGRFRVRRAAFMLWAILAVCAVGAAVAAVQLAPSYELLSLSPRVGQTAGSGFNPLLHGLSIYSIMFMPDFYGNPIFKNSWSPLSIMGIEVYCGIITVVLSLVAVFLRRNRVTVFFAALAVLSLLIAANTIVYGIALKIIPLLSIFLIERFSLVFMFSAAVLAGFGLEFVIKGKKDNPQIARAIAAAVVCIAAAAAFLVFLNTRQWPQVAPDKLWARDAGQIIRFALLLALSAAYLLAGLKLGARWTAVLCFAALFSDVLPWGMSFNTAASPETVYPKSALVEKLKSDTQLFRFHSFTTAPTYMQDRVILPGHIFISDSATALGFEDVRGYDSLYFIRYHDLIRAFQEQRKKGSFISDRWLNFTVLNTSLLKLLNIKYALMQSRVLDGRPDFEPLGRIEQVYVYRFKQFAPRARLVDGWLLAGPKRGTLELLTSPEFNPDTQVVLEKPPEYIGGGATLKSASPWVKAWNPKPLEMMIEANAVRPSILVVSEIDYPGWRMELDGRPAQFMRANHAFRAVALKPGFHTIRFYFSPDSIRRGMAASMAAAAACLAFGFLCLLKRTAAPARDGSGKR